ncbi:unnamed protein product [Gongylonema pulchrum]|uniref:Integrase catalytic domain-containing protein n=1 Tax=Gongylonema pulchrum TaxID=637853 RepID=A0A183EPM6_9BILA|nr:unnamed protein product [Gongylonema pulchrum]
MLVFIFKEPFRWDQRLYSIVLRLSGDTPITRIAPGVNIPSDNSPIDAMCVATGGRSYCITSHKMLSSCIESIIQKLQQQGIVLHFEKIGPDPPPIPDRANGLVENCKKNGELNLEKLSGAENWRSITCSVYSRASRSYPGHWPIPEAFWPDRNMTGVLWFSLRLELPPRTQQSVRDVVIFDHLNSNDH